MCDTAVMNAGTCLCGALRYEVDAETSQLTHCHCSLCRKHHGAPFASFVEVSQHALRWLSGEDQLTTFSPTSSRERRSCRGCGAVAPTWVGDRFLIPAGNLSGNLTQATGRHVFVAGKPAWHTIADTLPQYSGPAPDWTWHEERAPVSTVEGEISGSCLCGDVSFAVAGNPERWMQCHCSRCRRARSAAHGSNAFYSLARFSWRTGRENLASYHPPDAQRFATSFCVRCGGGAPVERINVQFVLVPAALFDADPGSGPEAHIHMASRASWDFIADALPQFAELPS